MALPFNFGSGLLADPVHRYIAVFLVIITMSFVYHWYLVPRMGDVVTGAKGIDVLGQRKCYLKFPACEREVVDGWSAVRCGLFGLVGLAFPGLDRTIIIRTLLIEALVASRRGPIRPLINPVVSYVGYAAGAALSPAPVMGQ